MDVGFTWRSAKVSGNGTIDSTGIDMQRDIKYKAGAWSIGAALDLLKDTDTRLAIGYSQTIGSEKIFTRSAPTNDINNAGYNRVVKEFSPGGAVFLQLLIPYRKASSFIIKPYYHFSYTDTDFTALNTELNGSASVNNNVSSKLNGFGISLLLAIGVY